MASVPPHPRRVRTGCLKCRVRRRKCDEGKPRCQRCIQGGFECQYGTKLSFLQKNLQTAAPSPSSPAPAYKKVQFVTNTPGGEPNTPAESSRPSDISSPSIPDASTIEGASASTPASSHAPHADTPIVSSEAPRYPVWPAQTGPNHQEFSNFLFSPTAVDDFSPGFDGDLEPPSLPFSTNSTASRQDEFVLNQGYQAYREELRCLIFSTAQSVAPTREPSPAGGVAEGGGHGFGLGNTADDWHLKDFGLSYVGHGNTRSAQIRKETAAILGTGKRIAYLRNYVEQVAPWLDMFDSHRVFGMQFPSLARASPALMYAILAISARQMERKEDRKSSFESLELYQECIRLLAPLFQESDLSIVTICVLLCCFEMMSASAQDWRKHLEGCATLFNTFGVNGFSGGILQAVFWCYARMDLCGALISDGTQSTLVPPPKFLPPGADPSEAVNLFHDTRKPDMHANYAVYLSSRVCELIADRTRHDELGEQNGCAGEAYEHRWLELWDELQAWMRDRPSEFCPAQTVDTRPFPQILFVHWAAISSNQLHHTACVLMLGAMPKPVKLARDFGLSGSVMWHARRICGISQTNPHQGCLNNAIQPLWVAGRLFTHKSEHAAIVKIIWSIDAVTGWGARWRIPDLEAAWGYKVKRHG